MTERHSIRAFICKILGHRWRYVGIACKFVTVMAVMKCRRCDAERLEDF